MAHPGYSAVPAHYPCLVCGWEAAPGRTLHGRHRSYVPHLPVRDARYKLPGRGEKRHPIRQIGIGRNDCGGIGAVLFVQHLTGAGLAGSAYFQSIFGTFDEVLAEPLEVPEVYDAEFQQIDGHPGHRAPAEIIQPPQYPFLLVDVFLEIPEPLRGSPGTVQISGTFREESGVVSVDPLLPPLPEEYPVGFVRSVSAVFHDI